MIVVSPYTVGGRITHNYSDHVSILKFIERNWGLSPVTKRSRDNFPNPIATPSNPWVPVNGPAISDLFELFNFNQNGSGGKGNGWGNGNQWSHGNGNGDGNGNGWGNRNGWGGR
jgi:phospholipase C